MHCQGPYARGHRAACPTCAADLWCLQVKQGVYQSTDRDKALEVGDSCAPACTRAPSWVMQAGALLVGGCSRGLASSARRTDPRMNIIHFTCSAMHPLAHMHTLHGCFWLGRRDGPSWIIMRQACRCPPHLHAARRAPLLHVAPRAPPPPPPPPRRQVLLDKASAPPLPTEELMRLSLAKIKRAYSILGPKGAGMDALAEEE